MTDEATIAHPGYLFLLGRACFTLNSPTNSAQPSSAAKPISRITASRSDPRHRHHAVQRTEKNAGGINDKMLTQVLRELESAGIVSRKVYEVIPPKVEYSLTEEGRKLLPVMEQMEKWGNKFEVPALS